MKMHSNHDLFSPCALRTFYQSLLRTKLAYLAVSHQHLLFLHPNSPSPCTFHCNHAGGGIGSEKQACKPKVNGYKIPGLTVGNPELHLSQSVFQGHTPTYGLIFLIHKLKGIWNFFFPKTQYIPLSVIEIQQLDFCLSNNYFNIA